MKWFCIIEEEHRSGAENMARDQHILECVEDGRIPGPVLRLYRWKTPTLSLGYHQRWERSVILERLQHYGFDLVRRWTGGRAVLHINEITYSVVAPFKEPFKRSVSHNYCHIARALKNFTDYLFLNVKLAGGNQSSEPHVGDSRSTPCFATLSEAEIQSGEKKLIGSSQKLGKQGFLQHGSIPLQDHVAELQDVTGSTLDMSERMATLGGLMAQLNRELPSFDSLAQSLRLSFEQAFQMEFSTEKVESFLDAERIEWLTNHQFASDEWNFQR